VGKQQAHDLANQAQIMPLSLGSDHTTFTAWYIHLFSFHNLGTKISLRAHSHQPQDEEAPAFGPNTEGSKPVEATA